MNSIDKHFKSLVNTKTSDGTIDIKLHVGDITALLECLGFASMAAKALSDSELKSGSTSGMRKMARVQRDSKELARILADHLDIGEPESKDFN